MAPRDHRVGLLVAAVVGIYVVAASGTAESVVAAEATCTAWPTCTGAFVPPLSDGAATLAWAHRAAVLVVGLLVAGAFAATVADRDWRPALLLAGACGAYGVEVAVGRAATRGGNVELTHLALAVAAFALVVGALAVTLDRRPVDEAENSGTASKGDPQPAPSASTGFAGRVRAYVSMTKPRLMWLLSLVALAGLVLGAHGVPDLGVAAATLVGGALSIGASGVFNNVVERDRDAKMARTSDRPVASHAISPRRAWAFGFALLAAALACFLAFVNVPAALLDLGAVAFYSVVYTLVLKPHTTWNTTLGGAVGAFPAFIGYVAVTRTLDPVALALGLVVFAWTPAHFYNLALAYEDDYRAGGYPMLPVVKGRKKTRRHVLAYVGFALVAALAFAALAPVGVGFVLTTAAAGGVFLWTVVKLYESTGDAAAFRAFHASNAFLGTLLAATVVGGIL